MDVPVSQVVVESAGPSQADLPVEGSGASPSTGTLAMGGGYEGAERFRNLQTWDPIIAPANREILPDKVTLDARGRDILRNDAYVAGGATLRKDHIVGATYMLNSKPMSAVLFGREDTTWEAEFQEEVEQKFALWSDSETRWVDSARINTFTELVRLAVGVHTAGGEVLALADWSDDDGRPFRTAVQMIDTDRLSNPNMNDYLPNIEGGVERDRRGAPIAYHILNQHPQEWRLGGQSRHWTRVPTWHPKVRLRPNVLHVFEQLRPDQARGVSAMVTALAEMRMTKQFRAVELQRAVVAATYAASLESDLPAGDVYAQMGGGESNPSLSWAASYLEQVSQYSAANRSLRMDGVKIPVLMPGTKLKIQSPSKEAPLGADFEVSLLRHIAASLGLSYEQLSRDFSRTNYSSARAALGETRVHLRALKKRVADRTANFVFRLWLEEAFARGQIESAMRRNQPSFWEGLNADAYCAAEWIGAGQGQIDPLKETQAAALRLRSGLSTVEIEVAQIHGVDWRRVMRQNARELAMSRQLGLPSVYEIEPSAAENAATGEPRSQGADE